MLDFFTATVDLFEPWVGHEFLLHLEDGDLRLILVRASAFPKRQRPNSDRIAPRDPFSLIWHGPAERFLPQGQYHLTHPNPEIGEIVDLFMTPVGKNEQAFIYQSIFN
jgi:hypothetical protein